MSPGKATIGAVLIALCAAAFLAPSAGATKPCPAEYCTDSSGEYVLEVPPLTSNPFLADYADCVWNVDVDFGDGASASYVFDASVGLTGSHVFPTPGTTYTVQVSLKEGEHSETGEPCPPHDFSVEVLYRTPSEEADDPPEEPAAPPIVPDDQGGTAPPFVPDALDPGSGDFQTEPPAPESARFWRRCRGAVYAHLVSCRKARRVARAALDRLSRPGTAQAQGFSCRLPRGPLQSIACSRGEQRILAPGPDPGRRPAA